MDQPEKKKAADTGLCYGLSIGLLVGVAMGYWTENIGLWMCIGLAVGVCAGVVFDAVKQ